MVAGSVPVIVTGPFADLFGGALGGGIIEMLNRGGVPKHERNEINRVIESGNTVILIENEENEKPFVRSILQNKGAQNIHS
jgi:hypothetical protein